MNMQATIEEEAVSGAAGTKTFPSSDSRKYNYFEPKGRKATHYEDVTVDVQPDPERYLAQNWIISFANGDPTYSKDWTCIKSANWHLFRAIDQEWERNHYQRQSTIVGMIENVIQNGRRSGAPSRFDKQWVGILQDHLGAYKHFEYGIGVALMNAQRRGYTQMINNALLTNSSYKLRMAQDITLYLGEIGLDIPGFDASAGKKHWLEDEIWQDTRRAIETVMGTNDHLEQYFAINVCLEPLVGELFRNGYIAQLAAAQNDFMTPSVVSAGEADYDRNLANTAELFITLVNDPTYGAENKAILQDWLKTYGGLALSAAHNLEPLWSLPAVKIAQFESALQAQLERIDTITNAIGLTPLARH